jgi:hypothetical protein
MWRGFEQSARSIVGGTGCGRADANASDHNQLDGVDNADKVR